MSVPITPGEWITSEEQLARWLDGKPVHRQFKLKHVDKTGAVVAESDCDECVPDFSCCRPNLLSERSIREAFVAASQSERMKFLGTFLRAMLVDVDLNPKIAITGELPT